MPPLVITSSDVVIINLPQVEPTFLLGTFNIHAFALFVPFRYFTVVTFTNDVLRVKPSDPFLKKKKTGKKV